MIFGDDGKLDAVNSLTCNACELFGLVDKLCPVYKIRKVALNVDMDVALSALDHMKLAMRGAIGTNFTERRRLGAGCYCPSSISGHDVRHGARVPVANPLGCEGRVCAEALLYYYCSKKNVDRYCCTGIKSAMLRLTVFRSCDTRPPLWTCVVEITTTTTTWMCVFFFCGQEQ